MQPMQHSIAAKYAARQAASFVRPAAHARERRLGLRQGHSFVVASTRPTLLRRDLGLIGALRVGSRSMRPAAPRRSTSGMLRRTGPMHWTRSVRGPDRPPSAEPAWRG